MSVLDELKSSLACLGLLNYAAYRDRTWTCICTCPGNDVGCHYAVLDTDRRRSRGWPRIQAKSIAVGNQELSWILSALQTLRSNPRKYVLRLLKADSVGWYCHFVAERLYKSTDISAITALAFMDAPASDPAGSASRIRKEQEDRLFLPDHISSLTKKRCLCTQSTRIEDIHGLTYWVSFLPFPCIARFSVVVPWWHPGGIRL